MSEVALLLADPSSKPLRHLSFAIGEEDTSVIDDLVASCRSNRIFEVLKVITVDFDGSQHQQVKSKLNMLNGELLAIRTPSSVKWAFLRVVKRLRETEDLKGMGDFDALIISRIFKFAGSSVRRKVVAVEF